MPVVVVLETELFDDGSRVPETVNGSLKMKVTQKLSDKKAI